MEIDALVDHLFRHEAGRMLATLTHIFGLEHLDLAEDVVQEALLQALRQWPYRGVPDNPRAWLIQVARNRALDHLRRNSSLRRIEQQLQQEMGRLLDALQQAPMPDGTPEMGGLPDEQLAMIFACCHPALPEESRIALTLKAVSCLSVPEIARAFLSETPTIAQRIVRAKRRIKERGIRLTIPEPDELAGRLDSVLRVLYLVFNEGYTAHAGEDLVRAGLCEEAIRLTQLLANHPAANLPKVHALLCLFFFQAARLPTRVDGDGNLLLLEHQDRSKWDVQMLRLGVAELERCAQGEEVSEYHLQAGIAAVHATSPSFADTDWSYLLSLYDQLYERAPSPVVALNRAIAQSMVDGPEAGLLSLEALHASSAMRGYYLLPAARADLYRRLGRLEEAARSYREALGKPCSEPERRFLEGRLRDIRRGE